jgi:hypothetical protein
VEQKNGDAIYFYICLGGGWAGWPGGRGKVKDTSTAPDEAKVFVYAISMRALYMLAFYSMCERSRDLTPPPEVAVNSSSMRHVLRRLLSLLPRMWA